MIRVSLAALLSLIVQCPVTGQIPVTGQPPTVAATDKQPVHPWNRLVGQIVTMEGLAWETHAKGLGQYLMVPHSEVYVSGVDYKKHDLNGRLLRVSGFLRKSRMEKAPPGAQGYSSSFDYFTIEALVATPIAKIENDRLHQSPSDWLYVGMDSRTALQIIAKNRAPEYLLSLGATRDNAVPHSYQTRTGEVILFYTLADRVTSITQIHLNGFGKADDEWCPIRAYDFPKTPQ